MNVPANKADLRQVISYTRNYENEFIQQITNDSLTEQLKQGIYEDYTQRYKRLLQKSGLSGSEMNPYRFRHTVCTDLFRRKVDIKTVQMIMGDNTADMILKVYANIQKEDMLLVSEELSCRMVDIVEKGQTVANG